MKMDERKEILSSGANDLPESGTADKTEDYTSADSFSAPSTGTVKPTKPKRVRRKLHEITAENDIRYRGPLSYRHFRIFGWLCLAVAQVAAIAGVAARINPEALSGYGTLINVLTLLGGLALPLFLIANFAVILNGNQSYKKLIAMYGGLSVLVYLGFLFVYEHYIVGALTIVVSDEQQARETLAMLAAIISRYGFFNFNIFIDLFLCVILNFFLNYRPEKSFKGKSLIVFRSFALLPILYEAFSIVIKIYASTGRIIVSPYVYPLLTTKPPMMFLLFIAMSLFIKAREWLYLLHKKSRGEYKRFLKTNVNSLHFSICTAIIMLIVAVADIILVIVLPFAVMGEVSQEAASGAYAQALSIVSSWGIGKSSALLGLIPFIMLFSYTRNYKKSNIDMFIPMAGVGLIAMIYVEGIYQLARLLPGFFG